MSCMKEDLLAKIESCEIVCGVVGLGYVGLPLAVEKAKAGFKTIGFDVQSEKVDMVNAGKNYIGDVVDADLEKLVKAGMLSATTDFSRVCDVDFIAICVPTPLDEHQQPDISYVRDSTIAMAPSTCSTGVHGGAGVHHLSRHHGGADSSPILEEGNGPQVRGGLLPGFFSRQRVDPGNLIYKTQQHPQGCGCHRC